MIHADVEKKKAPGNQTPTTSLGTVNLFLSDRRGFGDTRQVGRLGHPQSPTTPNFIIVSHVTFSRQYSATLSSTAG